MLTDQDATFRRRALRVFGKVASAGVAAAAWEDFGISAKCLPRLSRSSLLHGAFRFFPSGRCSSGQSSRVAAAVAVLFAVAAKAGLVAAVRAAMAAAAISALVLVGGFEFVRESIRKPYLMPGYMYSSQILAEEIPYLQTHGLLANSYWYNATHTVRSIPAEGAYLFQQNCSRCHSVSGFNDIRQRVRGRPQDGIYVIHSRCRSHRAIYAAVCRQRQRAPHPGVLPFRTEYREDSAARKWRNLPLMPQRRRSDEPPD